MGHKLFLLLGLAAIAAPSAAVAPARNFDLSLRIDRGDAAPQTPRLLVMAGSTATFMTADKDYSLRMVASPTPDGQVSVAYDNDVWTPRGLLHYNDRLSLSADGAPAVVTFDRTDLATGRTVPVRIEVRVRPTD